MQPAIDDLPAEPRVLRLHRPSRLQILILVLVATATFAVCLHFALRDLTWADCTSGQLLIDEACKNPPPTLSDGRHGVLVGT